MSIEVLAGTVASFGTFAPGIVETRRMDPDDPERQVDFRLGLGVALLWSFVIAAYFASKAGNATPYVYWLGSAAAMVALYETVFRARTNG